jgi:hypothetical protein
MQKLFIKKEKKRGEKMDTKVFGIFKIMGTQMPPLKKRRWIR